MHSLQTLSVAEALEQLRFPSFFEKDERKAAFEHIMQWGSGQDKIDAQIEAIKHPFNEPQEEYVYEDAMIFPS